MVWRAAAARERLPPWSTTNEHRGGWGAEVEQAQKGRPARLSLASRGVEDAAVEGDIAGEKLDFFDKLSSKASEGKAERAASSRFPFTGTSVTTAGRVAARRG